MQTLPHTHRDIWSRKWSPGRQSRRTMVASRMVQTQPTSTFLVCIPVASTFKVTSWSKGAAGPPAITSMVHTEKKRGEEG